MNAHHESDVPESEERNKEGKKTRETSLMQEPQGVPIRRRGEALFTREERFAQGKARVCDLPKT